MSDLETEVSAVDFSIRKAPPLAVVVGERLRQMLAQQVYAPGDRLTEEDVARRLQVSRTPVREALFRLAQSGLVEQRDGGFHVPRLGPKDVQEIFQIRRLLEPPAVADIARTATEDDLAAFRAARDKLIAAATEDAAIAANVAFRALWLSRIANLRMRDLLLRFDDQVVLVRRATLRQPEARRLAAEGVVSLVDAFERRDADAAHAVMQNFIDTALSSFAAAVAGEEVPSSPSH